MSNNNDSKKIVVGVVVGAAIGAGVLYMIHAARHHKTPLLHKIGKTICEVGEALENCEIESFSDITEEVQKALPKKSDVMSGVFDWISSGVSLLKKFKSGV